MLRKSLQLIQGMEMMNQGYIAQAGQAGKAGPGTQGETSKGGYFHIKRNFNNKDALS